MNGEPLSTEREGLLAKLASLERVLDDLTQEQRFTLGQTGVHLGAARVDYLRRSWASEEQRLLAEIDQVKQSLGKLGQAENA